MWPMAASKWFTVEAGKSRNSVRNSDSVVREPPPAIYISAASVTTSSLTTNH